MKRLADLVRNEADPGDWKSVLAVYERSRREVREAHDALIRHVIEHGCARQVIRLQEVTSGRLSGNA